MNVSASQVFVVEVNALTLQEAIGVNALLAMSLLQIRRLVKVLEHFSVLKITRRVLVMCVVHMNTNHSLAGESLSFLV
jgi:hypothetical protein